MRCLVAVSVCPDGLTIWGANVISAPALVLLLLGFTRLIPQSSLAKIPPRMTTPPTPGSPVHETSRSARARRATRFAHSRAGRAAIVGGPAALVLGFSLMLRAAAERDRATIAL